jgi:hypothetical protein
LHGSREQTAFVCHCDSLLPPCQPLAPLSILPNHCDSCIALLMLFHRPLRPRSQRFSFITLLPPPYQAVDAVGFPLWIRRSSNILTFRFSCPHKPPSAPPISSLLRVLAHSSNGGCRFCCRVPRRSLTSLTRLSTFITRPVRLQSQVLRSSFACQPSPCTAAAP